MCGIVGYISKKDKLYAAEKAHFMRFALSLDTLRGADSTGVMTLQERFAVSMLKTTMPGDRFVQSDRYKKKITTGWAQVGHNRAATLGSVTLDNAHPFNFGPVTLVHNGTLVGKGRSLPTFCDKLEVDSMNIAKALSEHEPGEAAEVLSKTHGSFALVWFDSRDESINMCRNDDRPMHFGYNKDKDIMWFMSDGDHLNALNKSFWKSSAKAQSIFKLDRLKILKWRKGSIVPEVTPFDPFDWNAHVRRMQTSSSTKHTKTGGTNNSAKKKDTAMERATSKWKAQTEEALDTCRTTIAGSRRAVPKPMLNALKDEFGLSPDDMSKFEALGAIELPGNKMYVKGTITLESWNNLPWDAVIPNCTKVQYNAYRNYGWLVRPIGIGPPLDADGRSPSVMCHLVHCDWNGYAERYPPKVSAPSESGADSSVPEPDPELIVYGPGNSEMLYRQLKPMLQNGCIQCGGNLTLGKLEECKIVNGGQDILCGECNKEMQKAIIIGASSPVTIN
jgi:predicted glutamine amidotransferase